LGSTQCSKPLISSKIPLDSPLQVLVLAAGKGTRFRSETPKVLHKVLGRTLIERVIRAGASLNPVQITVVVSSGRELVEAELSRLSTLLSVPIVPVLQENPRGTGDAVRSALSEIAKFSNRVVIIPGDTPLITEETLKQIVVEDLKAGKPDLGVVSCKPPSPFGYGRIIRNDAGAVQRIVEERDCTESERLIREINSSLYVGEVNFISEAVASLKPMNAQGELYFTDAVAYGIATKKKVAALLVENWLDLAGANTRAELSALEQSCRERVNKLIMESGVTLEDPATTYIEEDVIIGQDSYLGSGTRLYGKTRLGARVKLDGDTLIVDSTIGDGTHVKFGSMIEESAVASDCFIGPFAHLRPKSELAEGVHIGNFVETKASKLGKGTKANHLTYIGDAVVGERVNFGAGTITANYDGYKKHKTTIGDGASTGSNSVLVAPVTIGDGAYVGAGSVITKDAPTDSLVVARGQERVIKDWAKKRREKLGK